MHREARGRGREAAGAVQAAPGLVLALRDHRSLRGGRVLTSRRDAPIRHLVNEEEIAEGLAPLGFRLARCGSLGFAEQLRLFSEAEAVVGGTGSALSNAVFVPSGALMMELHNYEGARFLDFLCMQLGQYYERVIGELRPQAPKTKLHDCDFHVPLGRLRERLAAAGLPQPSQGS